MSVCTDCNDDSHQCTECGNAYFSIPCEQWHDKEQVTFNGGVKYGEWKGYAACLADVVACHREKASHFRHLNLLADWHNECADAFERGEAKGAANE